MDAFNVDQIRFSDRSLLLGGETTIESTQNHIDDVCVFLGIAVIFWCYYIDTNVAVLVRLVVIRIGLAGVG